MTLDAATAALDSAIQVLSAMSRGLAAQLEKEGRLSRSRLDQRQPSAFQLARTLAEVESAKSMLSYARRLDRPYETALACVHIAHTVRDLAHAVAFRLSDFGLTVDDVAPLHAHQAFIEETLADAHLAELADELFERRTDKGGSYGLSSEHIEMQHVFGRFADDKVAPVAEEIHREDRLIPEPLLQELAELGVFGISIPEEYGGHMVDHLTMCIATEELSRASLGAGGSVITRPEICAKALLKGGTEAQKQKWLPGIAAGEHIVSIAVTEPNAGSDVAGLSVSAKKVEGGYLINGEKTWCTFAGRADVFALLARTGKMEDRHRGLTLFLVEKPAQKPGQDEYKFLYTQPDGGRVEGHAIPTVGYRGMHSFSVTFEDYFVPEENRIGDEGQGFGLQMEGFAGGRIQTAARAVGVMEAAFRKAVEYATERQVFGKPLSAFSLTRARLVEMAAEVQACRQLAYDVARMMDEGAGQMEASLVKLLSCSVAEVVTRDAMQLHGGMGYSEEFAVSRYWQDARVLSIFEGAEEVLALYVVARQHLRETLAGLA